jgi:ribosome-binding protein aMBF1 (putative translation factor)
MAVAQDYDYECPVHRQGNMTVDLAGERAKQIRKARALLGWSRDRLASTAELMLTDVIHLERGTARGRDEAFDAVLRALEAAGVEFIDPNCGGPGVRLREP